MKNRVVEAPMSLGGSVSRSNCYYISISAATLKEMASRLFAVQLPEL